MKATNSAVHLFDNLDDLERMITTANATLHRSKESAMEAAAHCYMIWLGTREGAAGNWLRDAIAAKNDAIDKHNKGEKERYDEAKDYLAGKLKADHIAVKKTKGDAEKKRQEEKIAEFTTLSKMSEKERQRRRKMRIEGRAGASPFTEIVKYVFGFENFSDATLVSRYALALDWIDMAFFKSHPADYAEIVTTMRDAGGFEQVIEAQRLVANDNIESGAGIDTKKAMEAFLKDAGDALSLKSGKEALASFKMEVTTSSNNAVLLLGHYVGGQVRVVGEAVLGKEDVDRALRNYGDTVGLSSNPHIEAINRIFSVGTVVREGEATNIVKSGTTVGEKIKTSRVAVLRKQDDRPQVVLSARYADASAVVYAFPKNMPELQPIDKPLYLRGESRKRLEKALSNPAERRLLEIRADANPKRADVKPADADLSWVAEYRADVAKDSGMIQQYWWYDLANQERKPLEVEGFRPQLSVEIGMADVKSLLNGSLKDWRESQNGKKASVVMELAFKGSEMILRWEGKPHQVVKLAAPAAEALALAFLARDLNTLFSKLAEQHADAFRISADDGGMISVAWSDEYCDYEIYQPSVTNDGRLQSKRVGLMRAGAPMMQAAE
jgi:hypothetical protein